MRLLVASCASRKSGCLGSITLLRQVLLSRPLHSTVQRTLDPNFDHLRRKASFSYPQAFTLRTTFLLQVVMVRQRITLIRAAFRPRLRPSDIFRTPKLLNRLRELKLKANGALPPGLRLGALSVRSVTAACTFALSGDARGRFLLPREIRDRSARMVIRVGNVDEVIRRVNCDLEKVGKAPVGAAEEAAG